MSVTPGTSLPSPPGPGNPWSWSGVIRPWLNDLLARTGRVSLTRDGRGVLRGTDQSTRVVRLPDIDSGTGRIDPAVTPRHGDLEGLGGHAPSATGADAHLVARTTTGGGWELVPYAAADSEGTDHRALTHRDSPDQHPISAVTGLTEALDEASGDPPTWDTIEGRPDVVAAGRTQTVARESIGAGTSDLVLGTSAGRAARGDHAHDDRYVRTVNGTGPDSSGDVTVEGGGGQPGVSSLSSSSTTLTADDVGSLLYSTSPSARTVLVQPNTIPPGATVRVARAGSGSVTIQGVDAMSIRPPDVFDGISLARDQVATLHFTTAFQCIVSLGEVPA